MSAQIPAFPTAQGFGSMTPGGRGGTIYHVTNPSDADIVGTLRHAINASGPRHIVFDGAMNIICHTPLKIRNPFISIWGQSAPGEGITIQGDEFRIQTNDFIVQYIRKRTGDLFEPADGWENGDAINFGINGQPGVCYNGILDHCSMSWSIDETCTAWAGTHDITISNCILSEALWHSFHPNGPHSDGGLVGSSDVGFPSYNVSVHHNLNISNNQRNWQLSYCDMIDYVNNVHYNCGEFCLEVEKPGLKRMNVRKNIWIKGPNSSATLKGAIKVSSDVGDSNGKVGIRLFVEGNIDPYSGLSDPNADNWIMVKDISGQQAPTFYNGDQLQMSTPFATPPIKMTTAAQALICVPANAGCTRPYRDGIDDRVIDTMLNNNGAIIDSQEAVGGFEAMAAGTLPTDTDGDGMPDDWETRYGLNPNDPSDANADRDGDGRTNLEEYMAYKAL